MAKATITGTVEEVALTKAYLKLKQGKIDDDQFIATATALGYTVSKNYLTSFTDYAYETALKLLER